MIEDNAGLVPVIKINKEKCINCHRCIAVCPVKMCNDGSGETLSLRSELCIGCGECIRICERGARVGIDDFDAFIKDVKKTKIIAIVAPAVAASFGKDYLKLNGFLKKLGVKAVFDVSFGAELTIKSYLAYKKAKNPRVIIAQPCPSLVSFIEIYHPELIAHLAPADSPMGHIMKVIRKFYPQYAECKIAAISPCYAKRREFNCIGLGDYNVTFNSIQQYLDIEGERLEIYNAENYDNPPAERAVMFSTPGGLMQTLARYDSSALYNTRKIEGIPDAYNYLAKFKYFINNKNPTCSLIDCLSCKLGCNGGAGSTAKKQYMEDIEMNIEKRAGEAKAYYKRSFFSKAKLERTLNKYWVEGLFTRSYKDRSSVFREIIKRPSKEDLNTVYNRLHKIKEEDFSNCGACGYNSCEQMAVAIFNGLNKPENCWHYIMMQNKVLENKYKNDLKLAIDKIYDRTLQDINGSISGINSLLSRTIEAISNINDSSTTIEAMVRGIQSLNENIKHNAETVARLNTSSLEGKSQLTKLSELVSKVAEQSNALINISKIIKSVYDETKILGMNASIEAAHAGEVGKGFAVVANEIRHLADAAGAQSQDIEHNLMNIKVLIDSSAEFTVHAQNQFDMIITLVNAVKVEEQIIASAVEAESSNGKQVIDALNMINKLIDSLKNETTVLLNSSQSVLANMGSLKNI